MFVVPLAQAGLSVEPDTATEPSGTGGADFAALMALAAAFLTPPQTPATVPTAPAPGGTCDTGDTSGAADAAAVLPGFGWPGSGPVPMFTSAPAVTPGATPAPLPAAAAASPAVSSAVEAGEPAVEAGEPALEALAGMTELSRRETGPTGAKRAEMFEPSGDAPTGSAAAAPGLPGLAPVEAGGESEADGPEAKPVASATAGHDRLPGVHAHPGGALPAAEAGRSGDAPATVAPVHPPVADQVVSVVEPLRHRGDGHHELTLDLRPAELGPIRVEVSIERGTVHLSLHADQPATGTLLHQAMPELRAALEEAGLVAGRLGVGPGDREGGRPPAQPRPAESDEPGARRPQAAAAVASIRPTAAPAAGALDVLL